MDKIWDYSIKILAVVGLSYLIILGIKSYGDHQREQGKIEAEADQLESSQTPIQFSEDPPVNTTYSRYDNEKDKPTIFLQVENERVIKNLGNKYIISGTIKNDAMIAMFSSIVVETSFFDGNNVLLGKAQHTIKNEVHPGGSIDFEYRARRPKFTDSYKMVVVDGVARK